MQSCLQCALVFPHFMSCIAIGAKIDVEKGTVEVVGGGVPDSFHFSFNRIVTVVFVVNIVVLLCKYNINSNADKRFGNMIKNEKLCFFIPTSFPQIYHGRNLTFVTPLGILYVPQCIYIALFESTLVGTTGKDEKRVA